MIFRNPLRMALAFGVIHCLVDATCIALLFNSDPQTVIADSDYKATAILYNVLAFGLQLPAGWFFDRRGNYGLSAFLGMISLALGLLVSPMSITFAVILAAFGNALFHVGAGAMVLRSTPGRAYSAGVFVGPGALGVFLGTQANLDGGLSRAILMLVIMLIGLLFLGRSFKNISIPATDAYRPRLQKPRMMLVCIVLLCVSVAVRSMAGGSLNSLHAHAGLGMAFALALVAMVGKMAGGFLGDRFGWRSMTAIALSGLAILVPFLPQSIYATASGMLLLQMTMAVMLAAIYAMIPDRPGVAFGLPSMALLAGVIPSFVLSPSLISPFVWPGVLLALVTSYIALGYLKLNTDLPQVYRRAVAGFGRLDN